MSLVMSLEAIPRNQPAAQPNRWGASFLSAERKETMALVNGFSILCSASKEMLLNITARSAYRPVSLPALSFVSLVQEARKQKSKASAPAAEATALPHRNFRGPRFSASSFAGVSYHRRATFNHHGK